jgi:hypothetical protein
LKSEDLGTKRRSWKKKGAEWPQQTIANLCVTRGAHFKSPFFETRQIFWSFSLIKKMLFRSLKNPSLAKKAKKIHVSISGHYITQGF